MTARLLLRDQEFEVTHGMTGWDALSRNDWLNGLLGGKENLAPIVV